MNEVEKHYGLTEDNDARRHPDARNSGALGGAQEAVRDLRDKAGDAYEQASDWARSTYKGASRWASDSYESVTSSASDAHRRSRSELVRHKDSVAQFVEENPIMVGVAGLAAGLLVGALLPSTRQENQLLGRYADEVREQGLRYAQDLAQQGRSVLEENLSKASSGLGGGNRQG